jgi:hypothetical protein
LYNLYFSFFTDYIGCVVLDLTNITPGKLIDIHLPIENLKKKDKVCRVTEVRGRDKYRNRQREKREERREKREERERERE